MSVEASFHAALLDALRADAAVRAALGDPARCYDRAPGGVAFPFLSLGRAESAPRDADGVDLIDHRLTLRIWGRRDDRDLVKAAIAAVRGVVRGAPPSLAAPYACPVWRAVYADLFTGPDGRTVQGLVRVRALLETLET